MGRIDTSDLSRQTDVLPYASPASAARRAAMIDVAATAAANAADVSARAPKSVTLATGAAPTPQVPSAPQIIPRNEFLAAYDTAPSSPEIPPPPAPQILDERTWVRQHFPSVTRMPLIPRELEQRVLAGYQQYVQSEQLRYAMARQQWQDQMRASGAASKQAGARATAGNAAYDQYVADQTGAYDRERNQYADLLDARKFEAGRQDKADRLKLDRAKFDAERADADRPPTDVRQLGAYMALHPEKFTEKQRTDYTELLDRIYPQKSAPETALEGIAYDAITRKDPITGEPAAGSIEKLAENPLPRNWLDIQPKYRMIQAFAAAAPQARGLAQMEQHFRGIIEKSKPSPEDVIKALDEGAISEDEANTILLMTMSPGDRLGVMQWYRSQMTPRESQPTMDSTPYAKY